MKDIKQAYDEWSSQYDSNINPTRDLEAIALEDMLGDLTFDHCLEIGCGTGKNTVWLKTKASYITALDLSPEMLAKAKEKIIDEHIHFLEADITEEWTFTNRTYDLVSFSLVIEHIEDLDEIFRKTAKVLKAGGHAYIGELHPFKQYSGSKARFETGTETKVLDCYMHHISDYIKAATKQGLELVSLKELFDDKDRANIPRILALLFRKPK